ncbi:short-chain dehydrogenase/reductase family 9C member 7-like [Babylonia areolata]|uniref:short-chain dehydrogenase/reductase family 9C member 7-like n=1 Tax=Babylonia areolata TaxID=304850 RepID=UPI003FD0FBF9
MDLQPCAVVVGVYAGLVTLGAARRTVRLTTQPLTDALKLAAVGVAASYLCCPLLAALLVAVAAFCFYCSLPSPHLPADGKAVFITGCDRGLGQQLAVHLDSLGVTVYAGCLFPGGEGEKTLQATCSQRLRTVPLDVTDGAAVRAAADAVRRELGGKGLWGVVNNAGIMHIGALEVMSPDDIQKVIEVNFTGQLAVIRAFLPLLRRSRGRLVNVASNAGLAPVPFHVPYCASKAAVASLTECLRLELRPFGVQVSTIIPSGYRTGIMQNNYTATGDRWWAQADPEVQESYGRASFYPENKTKNYKEIMNPDFSGIVHKMTDALLEQSPKDIYYKGVLARSLPFLYLHTPTPIADLFLPAFVTWYKFDPPGARPPTTTTPTSTPTSQEGEKED